MRHIFGFSRNARGHFGNAREVGPDAPFSRNCARSGSTAHSRSSPNPRAPPPTSKEETCTNVPHLQHPYSWLFLPKRPLTYLIRLMEGAGGGEGGRKRREGGWEWKENKNKLCSMTCGGKKTEQKINLVPVTQKQDGSSLTMIS